MRALCEKVIPSPGCSWRYCLYTLNSIPFNWHYHPEYEICLTLNATGKCHIGDHIGEFTELDLVILGPNLPHTWQSNPNSNGEEQFVHVAQIPVKWLEETVLSCPESSPLQTLLHKAKWGIRFSAESALLAKQAFEKMAQASPFERMLQLFQILQVMIEDKSAVQLATTDYHQSTLLDNAKDKFDRVVHYIYEHYTEDLNARALAEIAHMSTNHFHRFFKRRMERTVNEFVNELRIAKACKLLISSNAPVSVISDQCGFNNISNFNRRFQAFKECTPSEFRTRFRKKAMV
ncbi:Transcriptional regulator of N-acetylglucosamine utilization, AraC family [Pseudoalteromonas luteoviolacea B = ATCC 29581]|nr:Transcriptional regulator of N-acetylglucosamine utilization, AraC family [Pseudoalteromonas luteoviolacea B = ATCC 29581]